MADADFLSVVDSLMPWTYVRQVLCFATADPAVPACLRDGLARTVADVPYLARGVVRDDGGRVALAGPRQPVDGLFASQDLSERLDYALLRARGFPPSALTLPELAPPETSPPLPEPAPVLRAVLSRAKGGYFLCVAVHHCTTDITGYGSLLALWASHCRGGGAAPLGFTPAWLDRRSLSGPSAPAPALIPGLLRYREGPAARPPPAATSEFETTIFRFSPDALGTLKAAAAHHLSLRGVKRFSANDVLTALLWSAVIRAETGPEAAAGGPSSIGMPVNIRRRIDPPLPEGYLGAAFWMTSATASGEVLLSAASGGSAQALADVAAAVRRAVSQVSSASVRESIAFLEGQDDLARIQLGPRHDGISIVSWADEGAHELDWGEPTGKAEAVRVPKWPGKRYPIVLPRLADGGLEVLVSLERLAMQRFRDGPLVGRYASVVCVS